MLAREIGAAARGERACNFKGVAYKFSQTYGPETSTSDIFDVHRDAVYGVLNGFDVTVATIKFGVNAVGETSQINTGSNTLTLTGGMPSFDAVSPGSRSISGNLKLGTGNHAISGAGGGALALSALVSGADATSALSAP